MSEKVQSIRVSEVYERAAELVVHGIPGKSVDPSIVEQIRVHKANYVGPIGSAIESFDPDSLSPKMRQLGERLTDRLLGEVGRKRGYLRDKGL